MTQFSRYAVYFVPDTPSLVDFGARWLGWDVVHGKTSDQFDIAGIAAATTAPRKYGFHATLKPPFRLAEGYTEHHLTEGLAHLANTIAPGSSSGLELRLLGGFLALVPADDGIGLRHVAAHAVVDLDPFRAPATAAELARRRKAGLSPEQDKLLVQWGYPYVLDQFRFHLTLTGRLETEEREVWRARADTVLPPLPAPFVLDSVVLAGERVQDGQFQVIERFALTGSDATMPHA